MIQIAGEKAVYFLRVGTQALCKPVKDEQKSRLWRLAREGKVPQY